MTTSTLPENYQEKMQRLRINYLQRLKKNLRDIRRLKELLAKDLAPLKDLQEALQLTHNLTGSGATFGFPEVSRSANELNTGLKSMIDASMSTKGAGMERQHLLQKIDAFYEASRIAVNLETAQPEISSSQKKEIVPNKDKLIIGILARKENVVKEDIDALTEKGYEVCFVDNLSSLINLPKLSVAMISDDLSSADERFMSDLLLQGKTLDLTVPFIFRLTQDDFKTRLKALRLGASTSSPVDNHDYSALSALLASLVSKPATAPHIFVATKDEMVAQLYEHILQQAGIQVTILKNNRDPLKTMIDEPGQFALIDFDLPFCKGWELVELIRQTPALSDLRLILMSTPEEYNALPHSSSLTTLLLKPFTPDQLITILQKRLGILN